MKFIAIFTSLVLCICMICSFIPLENNNIYKDTVRLHIIAESDETADQMIKLSLRDEITGYISGLSEDAESADGTARIIGENVDKIREFADSVLESLGSDAKTEVSLSEKYYPSKNTDNIRLPAGTYTSLEIRIGKAEGHNWWCVLYPNLCFSAEGYDVTGDGAKEELSKVLSPSEYKAILKEHKYKLGFKFAKGTFLLPRHSLLSR